MYKKLINKNNIVNFVGLTYGIFINYNFYKLLVDNKVKNV